jgi:predicted Holliday junction resolvase-like endonuclease
MDKRCPAGWVLVASVVATYFLIGITTTGGVVPSASVLVLILVLWFSVYKLRHKGLGHREIITKMKADLQGTLEKKKEKIAQEEDRRRAVAEHEEQARVERERRRAEGARIRVSRPPREPAVNKYADIIEGRVREAERTRQETKG